MYVCKWYKSDNKALSTKYIYSKSEIPYVSASCHNQKSYVIVRQIAQDNKTKLVENTVWRTDGAGVGNMCERCRSYHICTVIVV
jgi:hypothetical protein